MTLHLQNRVLQRLWWLRVAFLLGVRCTKLLKGCKLLLLPIRRVVRRLGVNRMDIRAGKRVPECLSKRHIDDLARLMGVRSEGEDDVVDFNCRNRGRRHGQCTRTCPYIITTEGSTNERMIYLGIAFGSFC